MKKETLTYEKALLELQQLAQLLQNEAISIDDMSEKSRRAAELLAFCKQKLRDTEAELKILT